MVIHRVNLAAYPQVIQVQAGDTIRAITEFDYVGPSDTGTIYTALWNWTLIDLHNEIAHGTKSFSLPDSPEPGNHITGYVDITFPHGYSGGLHYGLYTKIMGVPGEPRTEYYEKIIELVEEAPPPPKADIADFRLNPTRGTYKIGDKVQFWADYKYKGKAQRGRLTISLGTGISPSFFTKHTFSPVTVYFGERMDWTSGEIPGSFTLPTNLEPGQTYSVRAKLEALEDYAQETDTDWGVFTVEAAPPPEGYSIDGTSVPAGAGYWYLEPYKDLYDRLDVVKITAFAYSGFAFDYWLINGLRRDYNPASVIVMDKDVWIECHFRSI